MAAAASDPNAVNADGRTRLFLAIKRKNQHRAEVRAAIRADVLRLIEAGADVNKRNREEPHETPLFRAVFNENLEVVEILLNAGADPNIAIDDGTTPLMVAAAHGVTEIVRKLIQKGANVNAKDSRGGTALMDAVGDLELLQMLVEAGADVGAVDNFGQTVLHHAVALDSVEEVAFLLEKGAALNPRDFEGKTPMGYAIERGAMKVAEYLSKIPGVEYKTAKFSVKRNMENAPAEPLSAENWKQWNRYRHRLSSTYVPPGKATTTASSGGGGASSSFRRNYRKRAARKTRRRRH
jgi:ankyrin repeat protein